MACERLKREQQRAVLARWRRAPRPLRERSVAAARGREAQLGFAARVKVAVRGDKTRHLQENLDRAAEAADNVNVDEVYRLLKPWMKLQYKALPRIKLCGVAEGEVEGNKLQRQTVTKRKQDRQERTERRRHEEAESKETAERTYKTIKTCRVLRERERERERERRRKQREDR